MFCPNCAAVNDEGQHYCRTCGLRLHAIAADLAEQRPSPEAAELAKRKKLFERLWKVSISISGIVGLMIIISVAVLYKLVLFGPEIIYGSAMGAVVLFALLAAFFYAYPRFFMESEGKLSEPSKREGPMEISVPTGKLLNESTFEPASVTENSTELLHVPKRK